MDRRRSSGSFLARGAALLAALASLALVSCRDQDIRIRGRLLLPDGTPAAGINVYFTPWTGDTPSSQQANTDANGDYDFVTSAQGTGLDGELSVFLSATTATDSVMITVDTYGDDVEVPPVRLWGAQATVAADASGGLQVSWPTPPEGTPPAYQVRVFQGQAGIGYDQVWTSEPVDHEAYVVPPEVTEDHQAYVRILAGDIECSHDIGVTGICVTQQTTGLMLPLGARVPLSRGATCTAGSGGQEAPLLTLGGPPCPLTDGLIGTSMPRCETGACPDDVVIDLGAETEIHSVVVHGAMVDASPGADVDVVVETSTDGVTFSEAARFPAVAWWEAFEMLPLPQAILAREIRLRPTGSQLRALTDLAVF